MNAELKSEVENIRDRILAKLELPELSPDGRSNLWMIDAELCSLVNIVLATQDGERCSTPGCLRPVMHRRCKSCFQQ